MIQHLGTVKPGSTLYLYFDTFAGATGASITMTGLAVGDIRIYKNGNTTERASTTGFTLLDTDGIDFDAVTGLHGLSIDLSSDATAGFFVAGAHYSVVISTITVDSQTVSFILATFTIGYPGSILDTTIATLASQTSFTLTVGPAEDDALNGCILFIHDLASAVQWGKAVVLDYTGSTKTVTLVAGVTFTATAGDNVAVFPPSEQPTVWGRTLDVTATGEAGIDWANIGSPTATQPDVNVEKWNTTAVPAEHTAGYPIVTIKDGTGTGEIDTNAGAVVTVTTATNVTTVNGLAANVITAASINADAITAAKIADGAIDAATFATGAITAAAIAPDAIGASELAADAVTEIQAGLATPTNITAGVITTVTNLTNAPTSGDLTATMKASVNAEVLDVLNVDTFAEPGQEAPAATNTLAKKIGYLFKLLRNRITQTSTTLSIYADDATTVDQKATVSDNGTTYDRGEIGSGP